MASARRCPLRSDAVARNWRCAPPAPVLSDTDNATRPGRRCSAGPGSSTHPAEPADTTRATLRHCVNAVRHWDAGVTPPRPPARDDGSQSWCPARHAGHGHACAHRRWPRQESATRRPAPTSPPTAADRPGHDAIAPPATTVRQRSAAAIDPPPRHQASPAPTTPATPATARRSLRAAPDTGPSACVVGRG
ncbi:hypothetical protein D3C81_1604850 [compost metagenome]